MIESFVTRFVKANEDHVEENPKLFFELIEKNLTILDGPSKHHIYFMPKLKIYKLRTMRSDVSGVQGTRDVHCMTHGMVKESLLHKRLSYFCDPIVGHSILCTENWSISRSTGKNNAAWACCSSD